MHIVTSIIKDKLIYIDQKENSIVVVTYPILNTLIVLAAQVYLIPSLSFVKKKRKTNILYLNY